MEEATTSWYSFMKYSANLLSVLSGDAINKYFVSRWKTVLVDLYCSVYTTSVIMVANKYYVSFIVCTWYMVYHYRNCESDNNSSYFDIN